MQACTIPMQMGATPCWATVIGSIAIALLFPMMERHVAASRPGYAVYKEKVLIPFLKAGKETTR